MKPGARRDVRAGLAGVVAAAMLAGCTTYFPVNRELRAPPAVRYGSGLRDVSPRSPELLFLVAFSGGGTRAAAFSYGVLEELAATRVELPGGERALLDEIDQIAGVSGGSFTAAYFGLRGRGIFDDFEERFLTLNVQAALVAQLLWPLNWPLLASPYFERTDLVARHLDRVLFDGATFADLAAAGGPLVQIIATDLATGAPFAFVQEQFDYLCSDLLSYRVSRAVAASSAVPGPMSPLTLRNFSGRCDFELPAWVGRQLATGDAFERGYFDAKALESYTDARRRRFIRLVDGGVADNLGVRGPFAGTPIDAVAPAERPPELRGVRWVVVLLVNAATTPETSWEEADVSPPLLSIIEQTTTVQINRYTIETLELMRDAVARWNAAAAGWQEPGEFHLVELDFTRIADPEERRRMNQMPTSLWLDEEQVAGLRAAARRTLAGLPAWQALLANLARGAEEPGGCSGTCTTFP